MKQCILLPNSLFDDDSLECKTWVVADSEGSSIVSYEHIKTTFPNLIERINQAIKEGKNYIGSGNDFTFPGYFEIQWD